MKTIITLILVIFFIGNCFSQNTYWDYLKVGRSMYDSGNYKGAEIYFTQLIEDFQPYGQDGYETHFRRAETRKKTGNFRGAIADYNLAINPNSYFNTPSYYNRGIAKDKIGDFKGAIADYVKSMELFPWTEYKEFIKGTGKFSLEVYKGTIAYFTKKIILRPTDAMLYHYRGIVKLESGQKDASCIDFGKAEKLGSSGASDFIARYCN